MKFIDPCTVCALFQESYCDRLYDLTLMFNSSVNELQHCNGLLLSTLSDNNCDSVTNEFTAY